MISDILRYFNTCLTMRFSDAVKKNKEATDLVTKVKKIVTTLVWRKDSVKQSHEDRIVAK